jgi:hypothetical protein
MSDLNIYQRINAVMKEVAFIQKDAEVQGYKAVTHDMVTAIVRPQLVKHGIVVRPEQLQSTMIQQKVPKGEKGHNMHLYSGDYAIHFVNIDKPEESFAVTVNAHANDNGDKAPGKALSYATKSALLKVFSFETGESDEARFSDPYSVEQFEVYHELLETSKAYEFFLFTKTLPVETLTGLVNSFPDGKKTQGKKAVGVLAEEGRCIFVGVVEEIQALLEKQDISVIETTDEMSDTEKRLLMSHLSESEVKQISRIKKAAA